MLVRDMADVGSWQNHAFQRYRTHYGDNLFEQKRSHALRVCTTYLLTYFLLLSVHYLSVCLGVRMWVCVVLLTVYKLTSQLPVLLTHKVGL